jgi:hypothetical protein
MGNRANFGIKIDDNNTIFVYQHWAPHKLFAHYANALRAALPRIAMGDIPYATRILISQIVGDQWNQETGHGISLNQILDNEHHIVVVDLTTNIVHLYDESDLTNKIVSWSIPKFITKYYGD